MRKAETETRSTSIDFFSIGQKLMASHNYASAINAFRLAEQRGQHTKASLEQIRDCFHFLDKPQLAQVFEERLKLLEEKQAASN